MTVAMTIIAIALATALLKTAGPLLAAGYEPPESVRRVISLMGVTLMSSLVVSSAFTSNGEIVFDARAAGLGVGFLALAFRAPLIVAALLAAIACSLLRAYT